MFGQIPLSFISGFEYSSNALDNLRIMPVPWAFNQHGHRNDIKLILIVLDIFLEKEANQP